MPVIEVVKGVMLNPLMMLAGEVILKHRLVVLTPINQFPHDRAREMIMTEAKRMKCDKLLFVDSDNPPVMGAFTKLHETMLKTKAAIVAGWYWMRGPPYLPVWTKAQQVPDGNGKMHALATKIFSKKGDVDPVPIDMSGMGFTLIDLHWVWDHLEEPYFKFDRDVNGDMIWEDISFCLDVREHGGLVLGDPRVRIDHLEYSDVINDRTVDYKRERYVEAFAAQEGL